MVLSNYQGVYPFLPRILGSKEHEKYTTSCASWNYMNSLPPPKIIRFVAQSVKLTRVADVALVVRPCSIVSGVLHPGNYPKQLQTSQAVHERWLPPPFCRLRRWFSQPRCTKSCTSVAVRLKQILRHEYVSFRWHKQPLPIPSSLFEGRHGRTGRTTTN